MKWWGWGDEDVEFPIDDKPRLWPWIKETLGIREERETKPVARERIELPPSRLDAALEAVLREIFAAEQVTTDADERILHAFGKSFPDLFRARRGEFARVPDVVVFPRGHDEVEALVRGVRGRGVQVIPFGGGTNIVGGVNPEDADAVVITLDLRDMNRLLGVDETSCTATIEGGALGPKLEEDLEARGFSLGHFPDSFQYSTLGGWLATRSAGMQSDAYGKIEDMVVSLRMVTPVGTLETRLRPRAATGPDLNQMAVGSEGVLGVITEATMRVHRAPEVTVYHGFLFRSFADGAEAMRSCVREGCRPHLLRLSDAGETELSAHMKRPSTGAKKTIEALVKGHLGRRGFRRPCLLIAGFAGTADDVRRVRRRAFAVLRGHGGFHLGTKVGESWSKQKYNLPYLRDFVMDRGCVCDVAETSTVWSKVVPLHDAACAAVRELYAATGVSGYVGCHISHTYETGACLYFTWATVQQEGRELEQYHEIKRVITETFLANGGALSHHHAVGVEHLPWMAAETGDTGLRALRGLKRVLDPDGIMNPGKLIP